MNEKEIKLIIGQKVKRFRKSLKLTQSQFGQIIKINQRQIAMIENGHAIPQLSTMIKLAKEFNCKVEDFYHSETYTSRENTLEDLMKILSNCSLEQLAEIYSISKIVRNRVISCVKVETNE